MNLHEEIEKTAYELWERDGRPQGRELEHWTAAEILVDTRLREGAMDACRCEEGQEAG